MKKDEYYVTRLQQAVISQIENDLKNKDYLSLFELLWPVSMNEMETYLSDELFEELEKEFDVDEEESTRAEFERIL